MATKRRNFSAQFKFKVALDAVKGVKTVSGLASEHGVHPNQIGQWKQQLLKEGADIFSHNSRNRQNGQGVEADLYKQIGRLKMELEWLKKKRFSDKHELVDPTHPTISIRRQCELLGVNRSMVYYKPAAESELNLHLMKLIDEQYTKTPSHGQPRMREHLRRLGYLVNHKRVRRLMQEMGLQAIHAKPKTSKPSQEHTIYPYLLGGVQVCRPNQVWCADITYVRMRQGFMYLVAIMDWFTRYVVAWEISNTQDGQFCLECLHQAMNSGLPEIFNTDQGAQFTASAFVSTLEEAGVLISMDGRGRAHDNIFIERLWRTVKYEDIYLRDYANAYELRSGLGRYFRYYNFERPHQSLGYKTPLEFAAEARLGLALSVDCGAGEHRAEPIKPRLTVYPSTSALGSVPPTPSVAFVS